MVGWAILISRSVCSGKPYGRSKLLSKISQSIIWRSKKKNPKYFLQY
jgi:hypothetical protein